MKVNQFLEFLETCKVDPESQVYCILESSQELHYINATIVDEEKKVVLLFTTPSGIITRPVGEGDSPDSSKLN